MDYLPQEEALLIDVSDFGTQILFNQSIALILVLKFAI
jgi:hypothetical protein